MKTCSETVTLIRHTSNSAGDVYTPVVISGASWYGGKTAELIDNGADNHFSISIRIPQRHIPADVIPSEGDFIVRGTISSCNNLAEIIKCGAVRIMSVRDNCRGSLPHWRLLA